MIELMRNFIVFSSLCLFLGFATSLHATVLFFSGDLRDDATVTSCGDSCTLGPGNTDGDYAQYAAVVYSFVVATATPMEGITYSYSGGTSLTGANVNAGGFFSIPESVRFERRFSIVHI